MDNERGQLGFIAPLLITELGVDMLVATYGAQSQEDTLGDYSARAPNGLHWDTYFHNFISDIHRGLLDYTTPPRITELGILDFHSGAMGNKNMQ